MAGRSLATKGWCPLNWLTRQVQAQPRARPARYVRNANADNQGHNRRPKAAKQDVLKPSPHRRDLGDLERAAWRGVARRGDWAWRMGVGLEMEAGSRRDAQRDAALRRQSGRPSPQRRPLHRASNPRGISEITRVRHFDAEILSRYGSQDPDPLCSPFRPRLSSTAGAGRFLRFQALSIWPGPGS